MGRGRGGVRKSHEKQNVTASVSQGWRPCHGGGGGGCVRPIQEGKEGGPYAAVVAGSAIQGEWLPEAIEFVRVHQAELARKPFAAFMVCITLAMRGGENYRAAVAKKM